MPTGPDILTSGANVYIDDYQFSVNLQWECPRISDQNIDIAAFMLDSSGKVRTDADFIFYNQPESENRALQLLPREIHEPRREQAFLLMLDEVPSSVQQIAFTISLHDHHRFCDVSFLQLTVSNCCLFSPELTRMQEKALIIGQLYRYQNRWKFRALGQGYQGGLAPLATHFGVDIENDNLSADAPLAASQQDYQQSAQYVAQFITASRLSAEPPQGVAHSELIARMQLDFSPQSLQRIDPILTQLRPQLSGQASQYLQQQAKINFILTLAYYLGNLIARHYRVQPHWFSHNQFAAMLPEQQELPCQTSTLMICLIGQDMYMPFGFIYDKLFDPQPQPPCQEYLRFATRARR